MAVGILDKRKRAVMNQITTTTLESGAADAAPSTRLTPEEPAQRLGVAKQTAAGWRAKGVGPVYVKIAGKVFYFASDIDAYIQSCRVIPRKKPKVRTAKKAPRRKRAQ
jgi:hypothetical protein